MKILVLATSYPRPDGYSALQYIHSRNQLYLHHGIEVTVISFDAKADYELDGVRVCTLPSYEEKIKDEPFDLLVSHAPNLRNHYQFIKKYGDLYKEFVFFFHGHEVLNTAKIYPKPYDYAKKIQLNTNIKRQLYDQFKLFFWRGYFKKIAHKSQFVFVSEWMYRMFLKFVKIDPNFIEDRKSVIYNCVGENFETYSYDAQSEKQYDFITIRNHMDGSKYSLDIVTDIAKQHPQYRFCVIGEGEFYQHYPKPENLEWINKSLRHDEIIGYLNQSKCALIPTRVDAQGVMACEMATFGIPVITSDIAVCEEVFAGFSNVGFISNEGDNGHFETIFTELTAGVPYEKNEKYFSRNTVLKEVQLFKDLANK